MSGLDRQLLTAVLAQMATTLAVGLWLWGNRLVALWRGTAAEGHLLSQEAWPERARAASNSFSNQFEVPVLFYMVAVAALWAKAVGPAMVACAWIFVVARILHAVAHCTANRLLWRSPPYFVALAAVIAMAVLLATATVGA